MVKVLLHLPYSHLPPTPHLLAVHKIFPPISFISHHFPRCQPGHIVRLADGILFLPPPLIWFSLSHLCIPSQFVIVFPFSSLLPQCSLSPRIPLSPCYAFSSLLIAPTLLLSNFSLPLFVASLGILSGSPPLLLFAPIFSVLPLSPPSLFSIYFLPPPAFLLRFSSPPPPLSLKVFAQSGSAQRGSTFCRYSPKWSLAAMSGASRLVPPMIFSYHWAPFLCAAYDSGATYVDGCRGSPATRLSLGTPLPTSGHVFTITSPFLKLSIPLICLFVFPSPPTHRRGGLGGTSLWHIVRLVLLRSSILSPLIYLNTPLQRPLSSTFFQTSPLGNLSYFKPYLVQWHSP